MKHFKRIGFILLAMVLLISMIPASTLAQTQADGMSDAFNKVLTDGKLVFNFAKPTSTDDEMVWIAAENFLLSHDDFSLGQFTEDFSKVELRLFPFSENEESHVVDVVWNYDADVLNEAKSIVENFPEEWADGVFLELSDLEFINYCIYNKPIYNNYNGALANYSSQLKDAVSGTNFYFEIQLHGQGDPMFYTGNGGTGRLVHNGIGYYPFDLISTRANHAIYIPANTPDTKEAMLAAAQKRVDDYIGENVIQITDAEDTVSEYYEKELAKYDLNLDACIAKLDEVRTLLAKEEAKEQALRDENLISDYKQDIASSERVIALITEEQQKEKPGRIDPDAGNGLSDTARRIAGAYDEKMNFIGNFAEDGIYHFLNHAAGGYIFNLEVLEKKEIYKFVVIKDDAKLAVPTYASTDFKTNVSVSTDSAEVPLDAVVKVEKITHGEEHERICGTLEIKDGEIYDIKLHSGSLDDYISQLKNGKFKVRLPIPKEYEKKDLVVYYVDADGNKTKYNVTVKNNFAFFETDHFSVYTLAVASQDDQTSQGDQPSQNDQTSPVDQPSQNDQTSQNNQKGTDASPNTGDGSNVILWFGALLVSFIGILAILYVGKKKADM